MPTVLLSSAAYVLSDYLITSEGNTAYNIIKHLANYGYEFHAISAFIRIKQPLPNLTPHQVGTIQAHPSTTLIQKYYSHLEFLTKSTLKAKKLLKTKKIHVIHHMFPAVYNQTFSPLALTGNLQNKPFIFGPVSAHFYQRPADEKFLAPITRKLHRKTITKTHQIITVTHQIKKLYQNTINPNAIQVIPLGIDINLFKPKDNEEKENPEILYVGSLYPLKGVKHLIHAFSIVTQKHPKAQLRIIGIGPEGKPLKNLTKTLKLQKNITFQGFVPHTKIVKYYQNCSIFCFPSLGEPFGKAIIEAMACAKPVIATNIGGATQIIKNDVTGILTPPAQPQILAEKILQLLDNPEKMKQLGKNARKTVENEYSWIKIAEKYHKLYQKFL